MPSKVSLKVVRALTSNLCLTCEGILFRAGPFLKEGVYQDLLVHELQIQGIHSAREVVFNYKFQNSHGADYLLGNNQCLRSDVELPDYGAIIELKSTTNSTKAESMWQLRNYLEQRPDRSWGIILNFNNKFDSKTSPKVQCDALYKVSEFLSAEITERSDLEHDPPLVVRGQDGNEYKVNRYYWEQLFSGDYPKKGDVFYSLNDDMTVDE